MYEKSKLNMKAIVIITILALSLIGIEPKTQKSTIVDEDLFKRELQESVLEFCEDAGIDPDSVYMPFRDEL